MQQVYELIAYVRRANENTGNLISVVQLLMNENIYLFIIGQGFINEALKRDLRELNVALTAVILIIVKTIPDVMKLLLYRWFATNLQGHR